MNFNNIIRKYYPAFISFFAFFIYLTTMARGVLDTDAGELAAVQYTLGIAHPTGYPLFTIIGFLFSRIPLPIRPIIQLNILATIWCVLAVYVFVKTIHLLLDNVKFFIKDEYNRFELNEFHKIIISSFGGLALAFSKTFWYQSVAVEVYGLNIFLFSLTFYFSFKAFFQKDDDVIFNKNWFKALVFLSLGFTNHLTTVFALPAILFLFFSYRKFDTIQTKRLIYYFLIGFFIVLIIYLYLPIRARTYPNLNWGNPSNLPEFINHITGRLYHQFLFPSFSDYISKIVFFLNSLSVSFYRTNLSGSEFSIGIILIFIGYFSTYFFVRKLFVILNLILIPNIFITSLYNIPDIDAYFLPSFYSLGIFSAFGLGYLCTIDIKPRFKTSMLILIFVLSIGWEIYFNHYRNDESNNHLMDDYTTALLDSVEKGAIVYSYRSSFYFPTLYYQLVEKYRTDVVVAEHLLVQLKWYYKQLDRIHPGIIELQDSVVNLKTTGRDVYFSFGVFERVIRGEIKLPEGYELVPHLFLYKLAKIGEYSPAPDPNYNIRFPRKESYAKQEITNILTNMLFGRAIYELQFSKIERAKIYLKKLKNDFPSYEIPNDLQKIMEQ